MLSNFFSVFLSHTHHVSATLCSCIQPTFSVLQCSFNSEFLFIRGLQVHSRYAPGQYWTSCLCPVNVCIPVFLVLKGPLVSFCRFDLGRWYHPAGSVQGVIQTEKDSLQTTADWVVLHHWEQVRCLFSSNSFVTKGHVDLHFCFILLLIIFM